ncbi:MAG TPA: aspartate-semialdehyde dehydrogenase, partial [Bacteroidetes bacterium]|nr:aspartate-semialdehyde dehydrogenase [Bacteroidota bacterium]
VFMAAVAAVAREWGWRFAHRGAVVIDKSSYFRDKSYAPLVIPEVNPESIREHRGIIANPNCTTIPLVAALKPLHEAFGLAGFTAVSFQSVSGSGGNGMLTLARELEDINAEATTFPHRIAHNVIPWIGSPAGGHSSEEKKMINEPRKILRLPRLPIRVTAVRVPIMIGHSLALHASFRKPVSVEKARKALESMPGVTMKDDPADGLYPMPLAAAGRDEVLVGRIRRDRGWHGLALWISADNLRKGAALNAVQIAEMLITNQAAGDSGVNTIPG